MDETQDSQTSTTTDVATADVPPAHLGAADEPLEAVIRAAVHVVATRRAITPSDQSRAAEMPTALDALEAAVTAAGLDSQG